MKLLRIAAVFSVLVGVTTSSAFAQSGKAATLNDQGKQLFSEKRYHEAWLRFKSAAEADPQGKYFFNVCFTLNYLQRYPEAVVECEKVEPNGADAKLLEKTNALLIELRKRVPQTGTDPTGTDPTGTDPTGTDPTGTDPTGTDPTGTDPTGTDPTGTDPTGTDPTGTNPTGTNPTGTNPTGTDPTGGMAPVTPDAFIKKPSPNYQYKWSLGAELGPFSNVSIGKAEFMDNFSDAGFHLRGFANFLINERLQLGVQGYVGFSQLSAAEFAPESLSILDVGGGVYKHFPIGRRLVATPLVGIHLAAMQPEFGDQAFIALGLRAEGKVSYVLGRSGLHALTASLGVNVYTAAGGDDNGVGPEAFALDEAGSAVTFSFGYTRRFKTPFGSSPLITLE